MFNINYYYYVNYLRDYNTIMADFANLPAIVYNINIIMIYAR